ncbi:MAG TPA: EscR/YscR/HrcR family type III secretion system export apparatus protein [Stenotrophomonas sp.]|nr:EscR/YscR/HrcR family type III secretion system export apparatus protein [Stenotrophomonas sp.]
MSSPDHLQTITLLVAVSALPLLVVMLTPFTKLSIVLLLLRSALGLQQVPGNLTISAVALAGSLVVMAPVFGQVAEALDLEQRLQTQAPPPTLGELREAFETPLREFIGAHAPPAEAAFVRDAIARHDPDAEIPPNDALSVLVPAFVLGEISAGIRIGVVLYIVLLVVDLVVANILMALGMVMLSPATLAIPLKLLVLVASDGLSRLMHSLILGYLP